MADRIFVRRDTAANWVASNPVLAQGEPALELDTARVKYGDGVTPWVELPYPADAPSVFTKTVTAPPSVETVTTTAIRPVSLEKRLPAGVTVQTQGFDDLSVVVPEFRLVADGALRQRTEYGGPMFSVEQPPQWVSGDVEVVDTTAWADRHAAEHAASATDTLDGVTISAGDVTVLPSLTAEAGRYRVSAYLPPGDAGTVTVADTATYASVAEAEAALNANGGLDGVLLADGHFVLLTALDGVYQVTGTPGSGAVLIITAPDEGDGAAVFDGTHAGRQWVYESGTWVLHTWGLTALPGQYGEAVTVAAGSHVGERWAYIDGAWLRDGYGAGRGALWVSIYLPGYRITPQSIGVSWSAGTPAARYLVDNGTHFVRWGGSSWVTVATNDTRLCEALFVDDGFADLSGLDAAALTDARRLLLWTEDVAMPTVEWVCLPDPQFVAEAGGIDLPPTQSVDAVSVTAATTGGGVVGVLASGDEGVSWETRTGSGWGAVDVADPVALAAGAMSPAEVAAITPAEWLQLGGRSLRFGFLLSLSAVTDTATVDGRAVTVAQAEAWEVVHPFTARREGATLHIEIEVAGDYRVIA